MQVEMVIMNRLIYIVLIGMLLSMTYTIYTLPIPVEAEVPKYFIMTSKNMALRMKITEIFLAIR